MNEADFLKLKLSAWVQSMSSSDVEKLTADAQKCPELDRCFVDCNESACDYYQLLLLVRTPTDDFRQALSAWLNSISEKHLRDLLDKAFICGEQSFCMRYCAALDCSFKKLIDSLVELSEVAA